LSDPLYILTIQIQPLQDLTFLSEKRFYPRPAKICGNAGAQRSYEAANAKAEEAQ